VAIEAEGRDPLTYTRLSEQMSKAVSDLESSGIEKGDRVALVLPNGPEMAVALLSVASAFACAPLNPSYQASEFDFFLTNLRAKAVIVEKPTAPNVLPVAKKRGVRLIELRPSVDQEAGIFSLASSQGQKEEPRFSNPTDISILLHTSGTTSTPKLVPITNSNICVSAENISNALSLTINDRCLNVLPLFHVHGIGILLASMVAGAKVVCTPGFLAPKFLTWLEQFRPTWYSAVPTMHQAILSMVTRTGYIPSVRLRFIRSASSPLPPSVSAELERVFGCPVLETYGMTEASHMIASNPLPPRPRKAGSVGLPIGNDVAIIDDAGNLLPSGAIGEIVLRGPNLFMGYENNPEATKAAFTNGWFRTGDQGYVDSEGYIFIKGRLKEIINRGGEKISPREVEEALLSLPQIEQAVAFGIPNSTLGEDVAAAVVLRDGHSMEPTQIRLAVSERLASFKVPARMLVVKELPKGPTGKPQRIGLAKLFGLEPQPSKSPKDRPSLPPSTPTEIALAKIWCEVLGLRGISADEEFLDLGGDSILATLAISRIRDELGFELPIVKFFELKNIGNIARFLDDANSQKASRRETAG